MIMHHLVRSEDPVAESKISGMGAFSHSYARFTHIDAADPFSEQMSRRVLTEMGKIPKDMASAEHMDIAMVNVWKPWSRPVAQNPLVILDGNSMHQEDLVPTIYTNVSGPATAPQIS